MRHLALLAGVAAVSIAACGSDDSSSSSSGGGAGSSYSTELESGIATFYDANGEGSCSFDKTSDLDVVALNLAEFAGAASCGSCIHVKGAKGEVTVRVVDSCPPCGEHHMDLSAEAFAKIDEPINGRV